ncbi:alpha-L-fucosidase [Prolixibacteraceae bacterium Z1-6]|uniref:alpha-L-fucosidase n=1 Tax=Draconibacterium aestuarii TaxID=2998507 RepID=A0A9X3F5M7_9BACT|nr:alpha-L-fucosidase [Prolixibacteraceae bacterium Z1-6]
MLKLFVLILVCFTGLTGCEKSVTPPEPFYPVPNAAQLNWHKAEYIMFAHFGMKTFYPSDDHMGYGEEDPGKFKPVGFDARQWVKAAKAGGFKGIVITAKHHDGFCNWQTETTDHCVKSSPWKDGKGDIIKELSEACRESGVYFGIYVSIIDKHFEHAGSDKYTEYGEYYLAQLKELSTRYGTIDEYWFDGYQADELKMDYKKIAEMIKENQPNAVIYDSGTMVKYLLDRSIAWPGAHGGITPDQNYRVEIDGEKRWYPAEPSIILQGNWFHNNTPVVSLERMQNYYLTSVGYGVTPLMNLAPNTDGLIDEGTVEEISKFKAWIDRLNENDLARSEKAKVTADSFRGGVKEYSPQMVVDGDYETYFATDDNVTSAVLEVSLGETQEIGGFIIQEFIEQGQRVEGYTIECRVNGKWEEVFSGRKIGFKRIVLEGRASAADVEFPATDAVRLKINNALACPLISTFQVIGKMGNGK